MGEEFAVLMGLTLEERPREIVAQVRARLGEGAVWPLSAEERLRLLHRTVTVPGGPLLAGWLANRSISGAAMGKDGTLYLGIWDGRVMAWNLNEEWEPRTARHATGKQVYSLAAGRELILGFDDGTVEGAGGPWPMHESYVVAVGVRGMRAASMDYMGETKVWNWRTGEVERVMERGAAVAIVEDGRRGHCSLLWAGEILLGYSLGQVTAWRWRTGEIAWIRQLDALNAGAFALHPGGRRALVENEIVRVGDGTTVGRLEGEAPNRAVYSRDGSRLYTTERKTPWMWVRDGRTGAPMHRILTGEQAALLAGTDGRVVGIPCEYTSRLVKWWNGEQPGEEGERHEGVEHLHVTADGEWAVSWSREKLVRWRVETGVAEVTEEKVQMEWPAVLGDRGEQVGASRDYRLVMFEVTYEQYVLWDRERQHGEMLPAQIRIPAPCDRGGRNDFPDYTAAALCRISPDGLFAAVEQNDQTVKLIRLADGEECGRISYRGRLRHVELGAGAVYGAYWSSEEGLQRLHWHGEAWEKRRMGKCWWGPGMSISLDGKYVVTAVGRTVQLWGMEEEWMSFTFDDVVQHCAISGDGRVVAVGDVLGRIHLLRVMD